VEISPEGQHAQKTGATRSRRVQYASRPGIAYCTSSATTTSTTRQTGSHTRWNESCPYPIMAVIMEPAEAPLMTLGRRPSVQSARTTPMW
jgi:hypothetical protein